MYIEAVPNRGSPPAILLRESFRDHGRVKKRTLANLSDWPTALVEGFRTLLKGGIAVAAEGIGIRLISPTSKLATARDLTADTACSSLGRLLGLGAVDEVELYRALDWLGARQAAVETGLAR